MNHSLVERLVHALLYEGYILYPYRAALKNRQRWTFGGLYPADYTCAQRGADACSMQTECLVAGSPDAVVTVRVRFLHLVDRTVGELSAPGADGAESAYRRVAELRVGDRVLQPWQEAVEREVILDGTRLGDCAVGPRSNEFSFPAGRDVERVPGDNGDLGGVLVRDRQAIGGAVTLGVTPVDTGLFKVTVRIANHTPLPEAGTVSRDEALMRSLVSTHTILGVADGEFVSLLDPPEACRQAAASCSNVGTWPVLVGEPGQRDTLLSSPIILYDYPQLAPESPGDFFDATEIDEMLALRILTLTDDEKRAMAAVDERTRALLARTEGMAREQLLGLHGTVRGLRPVAGES